MRVDAYVKLSDVFSGGGGMKLTLILDGCPEYRITTPMIIIQNANSNYPIPGVPENINGVLFLIHPNDWMDGTLFLEWIKERATFDMVENGKKRFIFWTIRGVIKFLRNLRRNLRMSTMNFSFSQRIPRTFSNWMTVSLHRSWRLHGGHPK